MAVLATAYARANALRKKEIRHFAPLSATLRHTSCSNQFPKISAAPEQCEQRIRAPYRKRSIYPLFEALTMAARKKREIDSLKLRERAERTLAKEGVLKHDTASLSREQVEQILHELRVHQIELQMQNEELQRSQEKLGELKERYFELYDLAPVGYLTLDRSGAIREINRAGAALLGRQKSAIVGRSFTDFVPSRYRDTYHLHHVKVVDKLESASCELKLSGKEDQLRWVHLVSRPIKDVSGRLPGYVTVMTDITQRKLAEDALKESEARYRHVFENSPDPMIVHRGGIIDVGNEAARKLLGVPPDAKWTGLAIMDFVHPDERPACKAMIPRVEADRVPLSFQERRFVRPDGTVVYAEAASVPTTYRGHPAVLSLGRDLTERRKADEELRLSQARYRGLFETMSDGAAMISVVGDAEDFLFEDINAAAYHIYQKRREEVIGKSVFEVFPHTRELGVEELLRKVWTTGQSEGRPLSRSENGKIEFWYETFVYKLACGELVAVFRDETGRRQAEQAVKVNEERLRGIFESTHDAVFIKDQSLRYTHVNNALCALLGLDCDEIVGRRDEDLYDAENASQMTSRCERVLGGQTMEVEEIRLIKGAAMTFLEIMVPLKDPSGEIVGVCGISRNITDRTRGSNVSKELAEDYPSPAMHLALERARVAAGSDAIVLLQGESGSGKDHLAQWIHNHSTRAKGPYISINCAALPRELMESELFGYERGAFTGAVRRKKGMLELAEGGTILLNEIGELDLALQSKLLVFLDNRTFVRIGGQREVQVDARLIAASHRDRLSVFPLRVPSLRERKEDVPILVGELMALVAKDLQIPQLPAIDERATKALVTYEWPGNVRELRNVLERSLMLWRGGPFEFSFSDEKVRETSKEWSYTVRYEAGRNVLEIADEVLHALYGEALRRCQGNKAEAARQLGLSRGALYRLAKRVSDVSPEAQRDDTPARI
jgi:PAS domain S-box-containing protein